MDSSLEIAYLVVDVALLGVVLLLLFRLRQPKWNLQKITTEFDALKTLEAVIDAAPVAIIRIDLEGKVTLWNKSAERIFGWNAEEALGQLLPIVTPEDMETFHERIA